MNDNEAQQRVFSIGFKDGVDTNNQRNQDAYDEGYEIGYAEAFGRGDEVLPRVAQGCAISDQVYVNGHIDSYRAGFDAGLNAVPYEGVYKRGEGIYAGLIAGQLAQADQLAQAEVDDEVVNLEAPIAQEENAQIAHDVGANQAEEVAENLEAEQAEDVAQNLEAEQAEEEAQVAQNLDVDQAEEEEVPPQDEV